MVALIALILSLSVTLLARNIAQETVWEEVIASVVNVFAIPVSLVSIVVCTFKKQRSF